jgi:hypothetical protein
MSKNKNAMIIAIVAGFLLLIAGISGFAAWETIKDFVIENITDNEIVQIVFSVLILIASFGGISVIIGGFIIGKNSVRTGKLFILLGSGMGLIGLLISIIVAYIQGSFTIGSFFSIGVIGLILSIAARMIAE